MTCTQRRESLQLLYRSACSIRATNLGLVEGLLEWIQAQLHASYYTGYVHWNRDIGSTFVDLSQ